MEQNARIPEIPTISFQQKLYYQLDVHAGRKTKFTLVKSLWFSELFSKILLSKFRFTVFFGVESTIPPLQFFFKPQKEKPQKNSHLSGWGINVTFLRPHEPQLSAICCVALNQIDPSYMICIWSLVVLYPHFSTLSSPPPFRYDKISPKEQVFRSFVLIGVYKKAVWSVVKSWEFEGNLRCSKMLRIWRKNSLKRVLSFLREYRFCFDITSKTFSEFEFWGEFGKSRDFFCEQI